MGGGEVFATFMSSGYIFKSSLENSRQLSWSVPKDARHFISIRELEKIKKNTEVSVVLILYLLIFSYWVLESS
jgi:hypothetical protein